MKIIRIHIALMIICIAPLYSCKNYNRTEQISEDYEVKDILEISIKDFLGSDKFGMHNYTIGFFKSGVSEVNNKNDYNKLLKKHLKGLRKLVESEKLLFQGPVLDGKEIDGIRGVLIFNCSITDAEELMKDDAFLTNNILEIEYHPLYGSAALKKVPIIHKSIERMSFTEFNESKKQQ